MWRGIGRNFLSVGISAKFRRWTVDKSDNVWVFNRGPHPVIEFHWSGKMLEAWPEVPVKTPHGLRLDADG
jgi:hypothetical protein